MTKWLDTDLHAQKLSEYFLLRESFTYSKCARMTTH